MIKHESNVVIYDEFEEGLFDIENSLYIDIVFVFHKSEDYKLKIINYYNCDTYQIQSLVDGKFKITQNNLEPFLISQ